MLTRNIHLTEHFDRFIADAIESGVYQNASEVVRDALRTLKQKQQEDAAKLKHLRALAKKSFDSFDRGEGITIKDSELDSYLSRLGRIAVKRVKKKHSRT